MSKQRATRFDPSQRTRHRDSFESLDELKDWLLFFGIYHPTHELERMWDTGRDYLFVIHGKKGQKPWLRIYRRRASSGDSHPNGSASLGIT